jgi:hypothetical protein
MDHSNKAATQFKKGVQNGPGRKKGVPNKVTTELKQMVLDALDGAGGVNYLIDRANDPKTAGAFIALIGKVLPMTVVGDKNSPITFTLDAPWLTNQIAKRNEE